MDGEEDIEEEKKEDEISENEVSEPSLEEIAEQPEIREANMFSESSMEVRNIPTATLQASDSIGDSSPFTETLERSSAEEIGENPIAGTMENIPPSKGYSPTPYQEYFGKSYAGGDYTLREKDMRERIKKEEVSQGVSLPKAPIVRQRWAPETDNLNWERAHERDVKDYVLESITKKGTKKRRRDQ